MRNQSWTAQRVELLRTLWAAGETAVAIGARLGGLSRSAILGKVFRLRLHEADAVGPAKTKQDAATHSQRKKNAPPARRRRGSRRRKPAQSPPAKPTQHKKLLELTNHTCRWVNCAAALKKIARPATAGLPKAERRSRR